MAERIISVTFSQAIPIPNGGMSSSHHYATAQGFLIESSGTDVELTTPTGDRMRIVGVGHVLRLERLPVYPSAESLAVDPPKGSDALPKVSSTVMATTNCGACGKPHGKGNFKHRFVEVK